jgi:Gas vesicle synthesis protein GvpO
MKRKDQDQDERPRQPADGQGNGDEQSESDRGERNDDAGGKETGRTGRGPDGSSDRRRDPVPSGEALERALRKVTRLTGREAESVSSIVPSDDGWRLTVELVELERIPESTNVMGTYEAEIDDEGNLMSYERVRRYHRNQSE